MAAYVLSLLPVVPNGVFIGTFLLCGGVIAVARKMKTGWIGAVLLVVFGYVLQDVAHMVTGEITFQSTYSDGGQVMINYSIIKRIIIYSNETQKLNLLKHIYAHTP